MINLLSILGVTCGGIKSVEHQHISCNIFLGIMNYSNTSICIKTEVGSEIYHKFVKGSRDDWWNQGSKWCIEGVDLGLAV